MGRKLPPEREKAEEKKRGQRLVFRTAGKKAKKTLPIGISK